MNLTTEIDLLYKALSSPLGIEVKFFGCSIESARARLYKAAKTDERFKVLQFRRTTTNKDYIWIVKGSKSEKKD